MGKFLLGLLLGILITFGSIFGGGYYLFTKVKLQTINNQTKQEIFGEDYVDQTLKQFVDELIALSKDQNSITLSKIENIFPIIEKNIEKVFPNGLASVKFDGVEFLNVDLTALRALPVKDVPSNVNSIINITVTLEGLSPLGIQLPDFPLINGGEVDNQVFVYTLATSSEAPFTMKKNYLNYESYYIREDSYLVASNELGEVLDEYKNKTLYIFDGTDYIKATDANNDVLPLYATDEKLYQSEYRLKLETDDEQALYVRTNGLKLLPLIDAFNGLSTSLDFNSLSLRELETKLGVTLKDSEGNYNPLMNDMLDTPINQLGGDLSGIIDNMKLADIITNPSGKLMNAILFHDSDATEPSDYVLVSEISSRVDALKLKDVIEIDESDPSTSRILIALKDNPINDLATGINALKLKDVIEIDESDPSTSRILIALKDYLVNDLGTGINNLTVQQVFDSNDIYDTNNEVKGIWRFILLDNNNDEIQLKVTDMNMASIAVKIQNANMRTLYENGILSNSTHLNKDLDGVFLGDLTLEELIDKVVALYP